MVASFSFHREILTGNCPFNQYNQLDALKDAIMNKQERPSLDDVKKECGDSINKTQILDLLPWMWTQDPKKRYSTVEIVCSLCNRPTFRDIVPKLDQLLLEVSISDEKARAFWKKYFFREIKNALKESPTVNANPSQELKHQPLDTKVSWKTFITSVLEEFKTIVKEQNLPVDILSAFKDKKPKADEVKLHSNFLMN